MWFKRPFRKFAETANLAFFGPIYYVSAPCTNESMHGSLCMHCSHQCAEEICELCSTHGREPYRLPSAHRKEPCRLCLAHRVETEFQGPTNC